MGDSTGSKSSKAGMQKKQGQKEADQVLADLNYETVTKNGNKFVYKLDSEGNRIGQVAGPGFSGSRTVDVVRDAGYQAGLQPGGLGPSGSDLEFQQFAAITGRTPEDVKREREMVPEVYGRDPVRTLGIDKFGQPSSYVATAPTLSELGGDIKRAITGGTYGSVMRGEPAPEGYQGIAGPFADLMLPGGFVRTLVPNIYQESKEFLGAPVDYTTNLLDGIFNPTVTETVEMNPQMQSYLDTFNNR